MGSGMARGAANRGKRIAFGDGKKILWDQHSKTIFQGNPNIAPPGTEGKDNIEWIAFHRGSRIYNSQGDNRWIWNYDFRAQPGEVYLTDEEKRSAEPYRKGFVVIEPNVPAWKAVAPNKQWPVVRYELVARKLRLAGYRVVQFYYGKGVRLGPVEFANTPTFRNALAILNRAVLYIGPEGGLHHGAAAFNVPAVVLFGGFIPPQVTGYDFHTNLTGGVTEACGSFGRCDHCRAAMNAITVDEVAAAALQHLKVVE